jgi:predicted nucleotide-binding protein
MTIILFADNDFDFLKTWCEYLEREGYHVVPASTATETRNLLLQGRVDLAILDIRLERDQDEKDKSGLNLAREVALSVPKIILTGYPTVQAVREALGPALNELPVAVDFIDKNDGPKALTDAVRKALTAYPSFVQDVFIVHGHDDAARETLTRFIEHLGLRPIILRDMPSGGRTIIAQIERYSRVGFVVVLLTPDDIGYPQDQPRQQKYRARQNVIFELGFFIGKLGHSKVCSLYKEGVEIPSDYQGVLYILMDQEGGWKRRLAQELDAAGLNFDHANLFEV